MADAIVLMLCAVLAYLCIQALLRSKCSHKYWTPADHYCKACGFSLRSVMRAYWDSSYVRDSRRRMFTEHVVLRAIDNMMLSGVLPPTLTNPTVTWPDQATLDSVDAYLRGLTRYLILPLPCTVVRKADDVKS